MQRAATTAIPSAPPSPAERDETARHRIGDAAYLAPRGRGRGHTTMWILAYFNRIWCLLDGSTRRFSNYAHRAERESRVHIPAPHHIARKIRCPRTNDVNSTR